MTGNSNPSNTGGGIFSDGHLTVTDSTVSGNMAASGGAISVNQSAAATASIINSTLSDNTATEVDGGGGAGGAIVNVGIFSDKQHNIGEHCDTRRWRCFRTRAR